MLDLTPAKQTLILGFPEKTKPTNPQLNSDNQNMDDHSLLAHER